MPTRILLIGAGGQLGWELRRALLPLGELVTADRTMLDLANEDAIRRVIRTQHPDIIVNAAAYTQVDTAEGEPDIAMRVNGIAPGIIAEEAKRSRCALIHYSTDYVFSGSSARPHLEDDKPDPVNLYGVTKLAGETAIHAVGAPHLVLRTSWLFGSRGRNFLTTILKLSREQEQLKVVDDQIGVPTWSRAVAEATAEILVRLAQRNSTIVDAIANSSGIYHVCCEDPTSWFGFARQIVEEYARVESYGTKQFRTSNVIPVSSAEYPMRAKRPRYSVLSPHKIADAFGIVISSWRDQLRLVLEEVHDANSKKA